MSRLHLSSFLLERVISHCPTAFGDWLEKNLSLRHGTGRRTRTASSRQPVGPGPAPPIYQRRLDTVNAALFMLTSAWMAGADAAPAAAPAPAPAVVSTGSSCGGGCATGCDDPCKKPGIFTRLRGRFAKGDCGCATTACAPAPVCAPVCKPAPVCAPVCKPAPVCAPTCSTGCDDPCGKPSFFSRFRGRFSKDCGCDTGCSSCGAAPAPAGPRPEVIPAPKEKKEMPKGTTAGNQVETIVTPVVAPRPPVDVGGPANPF